MTLGKNKSMNVRRITIVIVSAAVAVALCGAAYVSHGMQAGLDEQSARLEAVRPLLESTVTRRIKVGDSVEHAKDVLREAGLTYRVEGAQHAVFAGYQAGPVCGFTIVMELSPDERISKIEVQPYLRGL